MNKILLVSLMCMTTLFVVGCGHNATESEIDTTNEDVVLEDQKVVMKVEVNDAIKVNYIGTTDGELFDTSIASVAQKFDAANPEADPIYNPQRPYEPLGFTVGAGQMIPGFDKGVVGMEEGETKTLVLEAADAYGDYNEELIQVVPLTNFTDNGLEVVEGETYNFGFTQGTVLEINEETEEVTIDFNPRLAGKTLAFEVTVVEIDRTEAVEATDTPE